MIVDKVMKIKILLEKRIGNTILISSSSASPKKRNLFLGNGKFQIVNIKLFHILICYQVELI